MKLIKKIFIAAGILQKRMLGRKVPLLVSWALTNRCNFRCKYCSIWRKKTEELNTRQIKKIIDNLSSCGTKAVAFSDGEPLLRDDIQEIIDYCSERNIYTKLTTNGSLVAEKIDAIKNIDFVKLSFDGLPQVHDYHRQPGSYEQVIKAVELLNNHNIKTGFNCIISKLNAQCLSDVLKEAKRLNIKVTFHPLEYRDNKDFIIHNTPSITQFREAVNMLISKKKKGCKYIANSFTGLKYLYNWPIYKKMKCWAGIFHFRILPDGKFLACDRLIDSGESIDCTKEDFKEAFNTLRLPSCTAGCWRYTTIELNYLLSMHPLALLNSVSIF